MYNANQSRWKKYANFSIFEKVDAANEPCSAPPPVKKKQCEKPAERQSFFDRYRKSKHSNEPLKEDELYSPGSVPCFTAGQPGLFRHLHDTSQSFLPQFFQGASFRLRHSLNPNWTLAHALSFSHVCPSGYTLTATYAGDKEALLMPYFMLETSPEGYTNVEARAAPTATTRAIIIGQIAKEGVANWESFFDVYFPSSTASIMAVNREMLAMHYIQGLGPHVAAGVEVAAWRGGRRSALLGLRLATRDLAGILSASCGTRGAALSLSYRVLPLLHLVGRLDVPPSLTNPLLTLGYEYKDEKAGTFAARGSLDSDGVVGGTFERFLGASQRMALLCAVSCLYNTMNDNFELGFGFTAVVL